MKGREYHRTRVNKESKKELELNGNDAMEWNERIGMVMDKSDCDWSGWKEDWDGNEGNEWIENKDAIENEKQRWVVMRVMELK